MRDTGPDLHGCRLGQRVVCTCRAGTALDTVLIAALYRDLDVGASLFRLLVEQGRENERAAVHHVEWASGSVSTDEAS